MWFFGIDQRERRRRRYARGPSAIKDLGAALGYPNRILAMRMAAVDMIAKRRFKKINSNENRGPPKGGFLPRRSSKRNWNQPVSFSWRFLLSPCSLRYPVAEPAIVRYCERGRSRDDENDSVAATRLSVSSGRDPISSSDNRHLIGHDKPLFAH